MKRLKTMIAVALMVGVGGLGAASFDNFTEAFDSGLGKSRYDEDFQASLDDFRAAFELATNDSQRAQSQMYVALCFFHLKDYDSAKEEAAKVAEYSFDFPQVDSAMAVMLGRIALSESELNPEEAKEQFNKVIGSSGAAPAHEAEAYFYLGLAHAQLGESEEAAAAFHSAIAHEAGSSNMKVAAQRELDKISN